MNVRANPDRKRLLLLAAATLVGIGLVVFLVWQFGMQGAGGDSYYDKSLENPILPPGVKPGQAPPPGAGGPN